MSTSMKTRNREYIPSPAEISRATAQIRKGWTPAVRALRRRMARASQQALLFNCNRSAA